MIERNKQIMLYWGLFILSLYPKSSKKKIEIVTYNHNHISSPYFILPLFNYK